MKAKFAIAGAAVAALALAGCSSSDDEETEASPTPTAEETAAEGPGTIVEVAASNDDFSTLVAAVEAAGLVDTLSADGPYTVFAPTNEAFEAVGQETIDALLKPENVEQLTTILTYHVLGDEVTSDEVAPGDVATVEGSTITIAVEDDGTVMVNEATVTAVDVEASNGVIHVIDTVLIPPTFDSATLQ